MLSLGWLLAIRVYVDVQWDAGYMNLQFKVDIHFGAKNWQVDSTQIIFNIMKLDEITREQLKIETQSMD